MDRASGMVMSQTDVASLETVFSKLTVESEHNKVTVLAGQMKKSKTPVRILKILSANFSCIMDAWSLVEWLTSMFDVPCFPRIFGMYVHDEHIYLVLENGTCGSLQDVFRGKRGSNYELKFVFFQTVFALAVLDQTCSVHGSISDSTFSISTFPKDASQYVFRIEEHVFARASVSMSTRLMKFAYRVFFSTMGPQQNAYTTPFRAPELMFGTERDATPDTDIFALALMWVYTALGTTDYIPLGDMDFITLAEKCPHIRRILGMTATYHLVSLIVLLGWDGMAAYDGTQLGKAVVEDAAVICSVFPKGTYPLGMLHSDLKLQCRFGFDGALLLRKMLAWNPEERVDAISALRSPFFKELYTRNASEPDQTWSLPQISVFKIKNG